ncbi:MAG: hypothetical protein JWM68_36 [Verrucomicrobiales bacterium]|nr:hypothetical protein [Verrucomicrobiales bacterium]
MKTEGRAKKPPSVAGYEQKLFGPTAMCFVQRAARRFKV